jgi:hypothetical protein
MCHLILFEILLLPINMRGPMVFSSTTGIAVSALLIGVAIIAAHFCYAWIELPARVGLKRALDRQWPDVRQVHIAGRSATIPSARATPAVDGRS